MPDLGLYFIRSVNVKMWTQGVLESNSTGYLYYRILMLLIMPSNQPCDRARTVVACRAASLLKDCGTIHSKGAATQKHIEGALLRKNPPVTLPGHYTRPERDIVFSSPRGQLAAKSASCQSSPVQGCGT